MSGEPGFDMPSAAYPSAVATDYDLGLLINNTYKTLATAMNTTDLLIEIVEDISDLPDTGVVTIGTERIRFSSVVLLDKQLVVLNLDDRGFDGSTPAEHSPGDAVRFHLVAHHHNKIVQELQATQTTLGTSPTGFNFETKFQHNVMDYGAIGDGVADDTAAIVSALAAAEDSGEDGLVYFPAGVYLTDPILINQSRTTLRGVNSGSYNSGATARASVLKLASGSDESLITLGVSALNTTIEA